MKFSVIIPVFNGELYIKKCLDSILNQNFNDYEVIVIDGGSKDETIKILRSYENKIKWISEKDDGQAEAINKGILFAKGEWIAWQNSDDYYCDENAFLYFMQAIEKKPQKKLFIANINLVDNSNKILRDVKYLKPSFTSLLYEGMTLTNQACFWKKELNDKLGLLKNTKLNFEYEWFLRILSNYPDSGYNINKTLGCFRLHSKQKSQNQNLEDKELLNIIKLDYGFKQNKYIFFKIILSIKKFFNHIYLGNFFYLMRGIFKFFFSKKNEEYIKSRVNQNNINRF